MIDLLERQLLFVTGKGGTGKTTVAAALGLLAAGTGRRTLVCEVEPKGDLSAAYECGPTPFEGRKVVALLTAMSMDTEASLREYLRMILRVPVVGRIGPVARAFDFVATAAPGIREILTIGKLCYEVRAQHYDLVVVDASATGHIVGQLAAPTGINELVKVGVVQSQTRWMLDILRDPARTGAVIVTTPEEMPVSEAVDLAGRLQQETPVHLACVIANRVLPELFGRGEEHVFDEIALPGRRAELARSVGAGDAEIAAVFAAASLAVTIRRDGAAHLEHLRRELADEVPLMYLPYLFGRAHGLRAIRRVAQSLGEEL
ncbi:MAG: anion-transporting ATPase [Actinomycetota bacterium]|nr:anion-transporting ATPase [Actinomycetota bacterium]